jgi:class 3 adenylate cyclase
VSFVVPIRAGAGAGAGTLTGFVASPVSVAAIQARVERLAEAHLASAEGTVFVVDERLRVIAHPDAERAHALTPVERGIVTQSDVGPGRADVARSAEYETPDGEAMVGTVTGIGVLPWAIVVRVPRRVAYASLERMRAIVMATLVLTVLAALAAAFLVARRITAPVEKLSRFAGDLAARRFDRRVSVDTRDELSVLADAMSRAAADLEASEERIRTEAAIRADLGRYLPAELVEKVVRREQDMELGGRRVSMTVLFADVVAFTPLTERLAPEDTVKLLNELFTVLTELVFRHEGTVDKFVGDCVMAIWGAPKPQSDHARRALACAEDMLRFLETANAGWQEKWGVTVQLAIGVNSGEAVVGNVGSEKRMEYTAIGDVVNVAARLEAIARPQQILITGATRAAAGDAFDYVEIGRRELSGRAEPVELFEVRT